MWDNDRLLNRFANCLYGLSAALVSYWVLIAITHLPIFPLREVEITGLIAHTTHDQVHAMAGQLQGNFFTLDLDAARAAFQKLPWVRRASVRRKWPDTLDVHIEEHTALARWRESALVNTYGELFQAATSDVLPLFVAPDGTATEMAQRYQTFRSLLQPLGKRPVQVFLSDRRAWELKLDDGDVLELGRSQLDERLQRLVAAYDRTLARLPAQRRRIDLRYPNGFAVGTSRVALRVPSA